MAKSLRTLSDDERGRKIRGKSATPDPLKDAAPEITDVDRAEPIENPDGSVTFTAPDKQQSSSDNKDFMTNLVEVEEFNHALLILGPQLLDLQEHDKEARAKRDKQYSDGIERTGLSGQAPGGADFEGASKVTHPVMAEAAVDFGAAAMKEICPAGGPVKIAMRGAKQDEKRLDRAKRKRDLLNELMTSRMTEYYPEKESLLSQLSLGGSQFEKYYFDSSLGRAKMEFVPIDYVFLPFSAASFESSRRRAHMIQLTRDQYEERVEAGDYVEINLQTEFQTEQTSPQLATDKVQGVEKDAYNDDGLRTLYEFSIFRAFKEDKASKGKSAPYIITVDESTRKVIGCYRNWKEQDERLQEVHWWVEDKFIPWRGVYGVGLWHLIGSLAIAATGALRALLDSAHINNTPAAAKLKGGRAQGTNTIVNVGEISEIECPPGVTDIRALIMPFPYNPPSPVLFQLLGFLTDAAKGVVSTAEEKIADATSNMPVGTTLALIEQGSKVFSQIHARLHRSQAKAIKIICRLIKDFPEGVHAELLQKYGLTPEDFDDDTDIEPVSDPNIFSESQRYAQWQAVMQMAAADVANPSIPWNQVQLRRLGMELLRFPDVDTVLPKAPEPLTADPISENQQALLTGVPLKAVPEQDHISHLHEHLRFLLDPMGGAGPLFTGQQLQGILAHCAQHVLFMYASTTQAALGALQAAAQASGQNLSPDTLLAKAAGMSSQILGEQNKELTGMLTKAFEIVTKKMPPQMGDPAQAALQAAMAETQRQAENDKQRNQLDQQKMSQDAQEAMKAFMLDAKKHEDDMKIQMGNLQSNFDKINLEYLKLQQNFEQANVENQLRVHEAVTGQQQDAAQLDQSRQQQDHQQMMDVAGHQQTAANSDRQQSFAEQQAQQAAELAASQQSPTE